jgi:hypothetical protein
VPSIDDGLEAPHEVVADVVRDDDDRDAHCAGAAGRMFRQKRKAPGSDVAIETAK